MVDNYDQNLYRDINQQMQRHEQQNQQMEMYNQNYQQQRQEQKQELQVSKNDFYLHINGLIKSCNIMYQDNLIIKYKVIYGNSNSKQDQNNVSDIQMWSNWKLISGNDTGISQKSISNPNHENDSAQNSQITWNLPFDLTFQSNSLINYPRIMFIIYGCDLLGRSGVVGYGVGNVPVFEGRHTRTVYLFKVKEENQLLKWVLSFINPQEEFVSPETIFASKGGSGREALKTEYIGTLEVFYRIQMDNAEHHDIC